MTEHILINLASILVLGVGAQWLAWRLGLPSILLLLLTGFLAGPVLGFLNPDETLGELLFPLISHAVAIILFEGGMSLQLSELRGTGHIVRNLVTVGALATWIISAVAAMLFLEFSLSLAALLGAILVVTGPTVIGPLMRVVRPSGEVSAILKWEGIVIDPLGASLAVLVFGAIREGELHAATATVTEGILRTVLDGGALGAIGAALLILLMRRYLIPDFLRSPVVLMIVISVFTIANLLQAEAGLLAVTVMGIILGNQRWVVVKQILHFKENLRVLLIGVLFVVLTARLEISDLTSIVGWESILFLLVIMLLARPACVFLSTIGTELSWRERLFLSWMAPRGIVAAAVSSLFALKMTSAGIPDAERIIPITFLVIVGTVSIYSLTAVPVARWLGVSYPNPQGVLIVGAHALARAIGRAIQEQGFQVLLVDSNHMNNSLARAAGLSTFHGDILAEDTHDKILLGGIGKFMALTANDEVNALAALEWVEVFDRAEVYQLVAQRVVEGHDASSARIGRPLFGNGMTYAHLMGLINDGAIIEAIRIASPDGTTKKSKAAMQLRTQQAASNKTPAKMPASSNPERFLSDLLEQNLPSRDEVHIPLFIVTEERSLIVVTTDMRYEARPGQTLIYLTTQRKKG